METSRKKVLEIMHKGLVSYKLLSEGWDISDHFGDGFDLISEKDNRFLNEEQLFIGSIPSLLIIVSFGFFHL